MSSEDFRHAPGWVKDGEAAGPDGVVRETGHVAGVKAQTVSAANAATGDTATHVVDAIREHLAERYACNNCVCHIVGVHTAECVAAREKEKHNA